MNVLILILGILLRDGAFLTPATPRDSVLVADRLDPVGSLKVEANTAQPIWLDSQVPKEAKAGTYKGTLKILSNSPLTGENKKSPLGAIAR